MAHDEYDRPSVIRLIVAEMADGKSLRQVCRDGQTAGEA